MTFRARLLRAIVGVVIGTTAVSLYIALSQSAASYRAVVDELFQREAASFQREQQTSLATASAQAAKLAESVRLFAALEAEDESVYQVAKDEMRLGDFAFFRLANAEGKLITPPLEHDGLNAEANAKLLDQLKPLPAHSAKDTPTSIGFVALPELYRVIVSPIFNFDQHMGSLVLAQKFVHDTSQTSLRSGVEIGGRMLSGTLPADWKTADQDQYRVSSVVLNPGSALPQASLVSVFSLADFHARQRALTWRIAGLGIIALIIATLIASGLSRQLAEPVRRMVAATHEIEKGNFAIQLPPERTNEINTLASSLNHMAAELALKQRYQSVLHMVADEQVANELIHGELRLGGELRQVTVIFCDIRGYTTLSAGMNPTDVIALLNDHMGALTRIVHARRGVVKQFTGDGIMILFGAPKSYGNDACDAAACALEMMRERQRMNTFATHPLRIGIGIASGEVVAGCLGAEERAEYSVVGERVNLAARLCSSAAAGEILVDETTQSLWPIDAFTREPIEPLTLKGYAQPVPAWRLLSSTSES
jgi:class 3 adenylate cyclase